MVTVNAKDRERAKNQSQALSEDAEKEELTINDQKERVTQTYDE